MKLAESFQGISFSTREKAIGQVVIFAIICLLFDFIIYSPKDREGEKLSEELESIYQKIQKSFKGISNLAGLTEEISLLEKKFRFCKVKFAVPEKTATVLRQLAGLCKKFNVEILSLKPKEKKLSNPKLKHLSIKICLRCDFKTIVRFLDGLKSLNVFSIVKDLSIERTGDTPQLKLNLVLDTFFLSDM